MSRFPREVLRVIGESLEDVETVCAFRTAGSDTFTGPMEIVLATALRIRQMAVEAEVARLEAEVARLRQRIVVIELRLNWLI